MKLMRCCDFKTESTLISINKAEKKVESLVVEINDEAARSAARLSCSKKILKNL